MAEAWDPDELLALQLSLELTSLADTYSTERSPVADYICPVCSRLLEDPMQTPCGHLVCRSCLERLWREWNGETPCPKQEEDCDVLTKDNVFPDKFIMKQIVEYHSLFQPQGLNSLPPGVDDGISCPVCGLVFSAIQLPGHMESAHSGVVNLNTIADQGDTLFGITRGDGEVGVCDQTDLSPEPLEADDNLLDAVGGARRKRRPRNSARSPHTSHVRRDLY